MHHSTRGYRPYRNRASSAFSRPPHFWRDVPQVPKTPDPPFGQLIKSIAVSDLSNYAPSNEEAAITECELITSFNWLDSNDPVIIIPGRPPRWTPLSTPVRLDSDTGEYFLDINSANYPQHPLEPTIVAALDEKSLLRQGSMADVDVDVVACAGTMGNLLRFVRGEALDLQDRKQFRMVAEMVGETLFLVRRENSARELIPNVKGFGHAFPEAYTTWDADVKKSVSHERILRYRFGGRWFLIRSKADGYIPEEGETMKPATGSSSDGDIDKLLTDMRISGKSAASRIRTCEGKLRISYGGTDQSQDSIFELKTRSARRKDEDLVAKNMPRLWISQIPKITLAYHNDGLFSDIQVQDVRDEVREWEQEQQAIIRNLAIVIDLIIQEVRKTPQQKMEVSHKEVGHLDMREPGLGTGDALSAEIKDQWANRRRGKQGSDGPKSGADEEESGEGSEAALLDGGEGEDDYTACSDGCGYCGRCTY